MPAYELPGIEMLIDGVTVKRPMPVFAAALKTLIAVGAVAAAGTVNGYVIEFVGLVQVPPAVQLLEAEAIEEAVVANVWVPFVNVVEVIVKFQPAPEPRRSFIVNGTE